LIVIAVILTIAAYSMTMNATGNDILSCIVAGCFFVVSLPLAAIVSGVTRTIAGRRAERETHVRRVIREVRRSGRNLRSELRKIKQGDVYDNRSVVVHLHNHRKE
jgi:hypothetical protein